MVTNNYCTVRTYLREPVTEDGANLVLGIWSKVKKPRFESEGAESGQHAISQVYSVCNPYEDEPRVHLRWPFKYAIQHGLELAL